MSKNVAYVFYAVGWGVTVRVQSTLFLP